MNERTPTYWSTDDVVERILRAQRKHMWNPDHWTRVITPLLGLASGPNTAERGVELASDPVRQASEISPESAMSSRLTDDALAVAA